MKKPEITLQEVIAAFIIGTIIFVSTYIYLDMSVLNDSLGKDIEFIFHLLAACVAVFVLSIVIAIIIRITGYKSDSGL